MRALRVVVILLLVLGGLFVAADRIAVQLAENEAAGQIQRSQDLNEKPSVSIQGFPFLTQVVDRRLDEVEAELDGITAETTGLALRVDQVDVVLRDVRISEGYSSATAGQATGRVLITYPDLTEAAPPGVTIGYGGTGAGESKVKVTAGFPVPILGQELERSLTSTVSIAGRNTVQLQADEVPFSDIPGAEEEIRKRTDFQRTIDGLPSGLELKRVEATEQGIAILVNGTDVELSG